MKPPVLALLITATTGAGFGAGWFFRDFGESETVVQEKSKVTVIQEKQVTAVSNGTTGGTADAAAISLPPADSAAFARVIRGNFRDPLRERRVAKLQILIEKFGPEHFAAMIPLIRENDLRGTGSADEWSLIWAEWGQRDGAAALKLISEFDWKGWDPAAAAEGQYRALTGWAIKDPAAARRYLETTTDKIYPGHQLGKAVARGWSVTDPAGAAAWLIEKGSAAKEEYQAVVEAMSRQGGQEAVDEWLAGLSRSQSPEVVSGFADAVSYSKRRIDPERGAAWIDQHLDEKWIQESPVVANTASAYASRDPVAAMEWAGRTGLESATVTAMSRWCQKDIAAASTWLQTHRESPGYGSAVGVLVQHIGQEDPQGARAWAETIPDAAVKQRVLDSIPQTP